MKAKATKLTWHERLLLLSFFCFGFAHPIFFLFTNTFLWRQNGSASSVILYNVGIYLGLMVGFFANRKLLYWFSARRLYQASCIFQGLVPLLLVVWAPTAATHILELGACFGFAAGLYFANRNFFTSLITQGKHRFAFLSLDQVSAAVSAIISPFLAGWYLTYAQDVQHFSTAVAYTHVVGIGLAFLVVSAALVFVPKSEAQRSATGLFVRGVSRRWNAVRWMDFVNGLAHGVMVTIPLLVTLLMITSDVAIGKLQSVAAIVSALSLYLLGKYRAKVPHSGLLGIWVVGSLIAGGLIAYGYSTGYAIAAALLLGGVGPFYRAPTAHLMYEAVDKESAAERAGYLLDREIFLDIGRVVGMVGCGVALHFAYDDTLRYGYLLATIINVALWWLAVRVARQLKQF
jgi:MFS family permease